MMTTIPFATFATLDWYSDYVLRASYDTDDSPKPGDKYYIEPERKAELEEVELDLRKKIQQLHQNHPPSSYAVNLDHQTREIIVIVENEQFNTGIEEIISQYPDDIPIVFFNDKIGFDEFSEPDVTCQDEYVKINNKCVELTEFVFGDADKKKETGWKLYPGGAGWILPENSTLTPIYKEVDFGMAPLDLEAMRDDKIFVNKCETNGGIWNYTDHDCEGILEICKDIGGILISTDVSKPCTDEICLDRKVYRISCVFPYEN